MTTPKKIKLHLREKIAVLPLRKTPKGFRYAVTNHGRLISFTETPQTGTFRKLANLSGYPAVSLRTPQREKNFYIHRLVAEQFVKQPSKQHKFVIHLNYKKEDNNYKNLKWATLEQQFDHFKKNPNYGDRGGNFKLTEEKVKAIKVQLQKGKASLKALGKKFGVSDMQIFRIKSGENWSHVKL